MYATVLPRSKRVQHKIDDITPANKTFNNNDDVIRDISDNNKHSNQTIAKNHVPLPANEAMKDEEEMSSRQSAGAANNLSRILPSSQPLSSIPEAEECHANPGDIDETIRKKLQKEFALLQRVRKSKLLSKSRTKLSSSSKLQLPPVCGKSPPCFCPEDQLYAAKLRLRILKKISTLRKRHIRLRVKILPDKEFIGLCGLFNSPNGLHIWILQSLTKLNY